MFSQGHIIFIFISLFLVLVGTLVCYKCNFPAEKVIKVCFIATLICEVSKTFMTMEIVPIVETAVENGALVYKSTGRFSPYIRSEHLPFYLCSLQILFLYLAIVVKNAKWKKRILSFIYSTALIGGLLAIFLSSVASEFSSTVEFLTSIRAWEFYLYHVMIIVVAMVIVHDKKCDIRFEDIKWTCFLMLVLDIISIYLNAIFSVPLYNNGVLLGVTHVSNFFSSYEHPLGMQMVNKQEYLIYLAQRFVLAVISFVIVYLPLLKRNNEKKS